MATENDRDDKVSWLPLILIALVIVAAWLLTIPMAKWFVAEQKYDQLGPFGDVFGAINALFSGLAFAGLFFAILLQRNELSLQRKELRDTREVLASQKAEAQKQNATLAQQTFDNTFFQLLRLHNEIVNAIDIQFAASKVQKGRDCFKFFYSRYSEQYHRDAPISPAETTEELLQRIEASYMVLFRKYENDLGHYFRSLYNIVKFVDRSPLSAENKRIYTNLVRAQLSNSELSVMFYNCVCSLGREKFKPLVERYSLLKHFDFDTALHRDDDRKLYDETAFN